LASLEKQQERGQWNSKIGFILAAAGSAVGLGNLWRFPVEAGRNGGGAFLIVYFAILLLVGFTLMLAELVIGRHTQLNAIGAYKKIRSKWAWVGGIGVLASFLILSFYSVIGGWIINYFFQTITGGLSGIESGAYGGIFMDFVGSTFEPVLFHGIFAFLTLGIVMGGISGGIEKYSKILMPGLFIMMIMVMIRSLTLDGAMEGVRFFLEPNFSAITGDVILSALGQVFFSLSLGMGVIITYGSYLPKSENLPQNSIYIPLLDTIIALIAGLTILPAVFALGHEPDAGAGLLFITLPEVFAEMPMGIVFGGLFFLLVLFAALTSSISLLEASVSFVVDKFNMNRKAAAVLMGALVFIVGLPSSLGMGALSHITLIRGLDIMDSIDFVASNLLLPIGGFFLCIFIGWIWGIENAIKEASNEGTLNFKLAGVWSFLIKFVAPIAILVVFVQGLM
jgi:neurotransmitter:Na+ symporter, NSS family